MAESLRETRIWLIWTLLLPPPAVSGAQGVCSLAAAFRVWYTSCMVGRCWGSSRVQASTRSATAWGHCSGTLQHPTQVCSRLKTAWGC